jgi:D-alanyl-D-alanine carboxypeptidase
MDKRRKATLGRGTGKRALLITLLSAGLLFACGGSSSPPAPQASLPPVTTLAAGVTQTTRLEVDQYMQGQLVAQRIPGMSLVVVQDGQVIYAKGYGYASLESARPVKPEDRFNIGSVSKTFIASAVMLLVEEGKMSLDDTLDKYIDRIPRHWSGITIRHLLAHTSGLMRDPDQAFQAALLANQVIGDDAALDRYKAYPLLWTPGAQHGYSNIGYGILGIIIGKVSGQHYFDFLRERIFNPLGMSSARRIAHNLPEADFARGYELNGGKRVPVLANQAQSVFLGMAPGGIQLSAMDMAKWDAALYGATILKKSTLDLMWTNHSLVQPANGTDADIYYGLGWQLRTQNGVRWVYHSGGMPGHVADFMRYPEHKITVIVLANLDGNANARVVQRAVARMFDPAL